MTPLADAGSASPALDDVAPTYEADRDRRPSAGIRPAGTRPSPSEDRSTDEVPRGARRGAQAAGRPARAPAWEPPIFQPVPGAPAADDAVRGEAADADTHRSNGAAADAAARGFSRSPGRPTRRCLPRPWPVPPTPAIATRARPPASPIPFLPDAPGAYVPPILHAEPAGPSRAGAPWAGQAAANPDAEKAEAPRTSMAGDLLDAARVTEFVGWLAVAGSAMAAVGFLLPWGVSVIGASGIGYFDRWGLAGPFHLLVFLSLLALLGLSLLPNPIPLWLRVGCWVSGWGPCSLA